MNKYTVLTLLVSSLLFSAIPSFAQDAQTYAVVVYVQGSVQITKPNGQTELATLGTVVGEKDQLITGESSQARVRLYDRSLLRLGANSHARMEQLRYPEDGEKKEVSIQLTLGRLWASVTKLLTPDSHFEIQTASAIAGVRGTKLEAATSSDGKTAHVSCLEGSVKVVSLDRHHEQILTERTQLDVRGGAPGTTRLVSTVEASQHELASEGISIHLEPHTQSNTQLDAKTEQLAEQAHTQLQEHNKIRTSLPKSENSNSVIVRQASTSSDSVSEQRIHNADHFRDFNEANRLHIQPGNAHVHGVVNIKP